MTYLSAIKLARTLPCLAQPGRVIVIGEPDRSLAEVIPFLAALPGILAFNPERCTLTFRRQPGFMTLYPDKVYITQVRDAAEGLELLEALRQAVNAVWEKRNELTAATRRKHAPNHLDIWELLPRTNCKQCGEATCLAFAVGILQQKRVLSECAPLFMEAAFRDHLTALQAITAG
jgi:ArsR family metal-binding transcriptional regulator